MRLLKTSTRTYYMKTLKILDPKEPKTNVNLEERLNWNKT